MGYFEVSYGVAKYEPKRKKQAVFLESFASCQISEFLEIDCREGNLLICVFVWHLLI
jgi:hypothetical protein